MTIINQFFIDTSIESDDRFDMAKLLHFDEDNFDPLTSRFLEDLKGIEPKGTYLVQREEGRPELLAFNIYGNVQYWWVLLYYNDILEPDDLKVGLTINYPSIEDLEDLFFSMKARETSS